VSWANPPLDKTEPTGATVWDGHLMLLHRSEEERQSQVSSWVAHGLGRGEKVVYGQLEFNDPHPPIGAVLTAHGVDVDRALASGQLAVLPFDEFYHHEGQRRLVERALAEGYPRVRLSTETTAALAWLTDEAYAETEWALERLCSTGRASSLCQFAATDLELALGPVIAVHADGVRETRLSTRPDQQGIGVAGEVDHDNYRLLEVALQVATEAELGTFSVDLSGISFLDVGGCRALVLGTEDFRHRGGRLVLKRPRPRVWRTLQILGVDRLERLVILADAG
jgi:anti-anti-sigma factor